MQHSIDDLTDLPEQPPAARNLPNDDLSNRLTNRRRKTPEELENPVNKSVFERLEPGQPIERQPRIKSEPQEREHHSDRGFRDLQRIDKRQVCDFYLRNNCRYGSNCKNAHVDVYDLESSGDEGEVPQTSRNFQFR